jgi:hypothetical protein
VEDICTDLRIIKYILRTQPLGMLNGLHWPRDESSSGAL